MGCLAPNQITGKNKGKLKNEKKTIKYEVHFLQNCQVMQILYKKESCIGFMSQFYTKITPAWDFFTPLEKMRRNFTF